MVKSRNLRGILYMLVAIAVFSLMDAAMKQLAGHYPPLQVAFLRGVLALPFIIIWGLATAGGWRNLLPVRWSLHVLRGVLAVLLLGSFIYGIHLLPLSEAYAIFFISPLLITLLSVMVLGESVDGRQWLAIGIGFGGSLVVLNPSYQQILSAGSAAILLAAVCYSVIGVSTRVLGRSDSTLSMAMSFTVFLTVGAGLLAIRNWVPLSTSDAMWFFVLGASGALGQYLLTEAFRSAEVSAVAPFEYTGLFWGLFFDWMIWQALPDAHVYAGAGIIIVSGIYVIRRQHLKTPFELP